MAAVHRLGLLDLMLTLMERGILAVGQPLVANRAEPLRGNGQAMELLPVLQQRLGQLQLAEILFGDRVVGGFDAKLQCQVKAGRRLSAARDPHQDDVGGVVVAGAPTIVVVLGEVDRIDANLVVQILADGVLLP